MARTATVDRAKVLELLKEGKTSGAIAVQFGVSRQAIDLYRKEFSRTGVLEPRAPYRATPDHGPKILPPLPVPAPTSKPIKTTDVSLDQMIDLLIQSLSAMKKLPSLEAEVTRLRQQLDTALTLAAQLEEREKKRLEQETRWREAQQTANPNP